MGAKVLYTYGGDPLVNIALEELLLDINMGDRLYRVWIDGPSVVVGYSTPVEKEVNLSLAEELGIPVVKRHSGGGAVYHDHGNINISIYIPRRILDIHRVYRIGTGFIGAILNELGVEYRVANEGDVVVDGYKVSGSAVWVRRDSTLYHGTLLVESNLSLLKKLTLPRRDLIDSGKVDPVKYNPSTLERLSGYRLGDILHAIEKVFGVERAAHLNGRVIDLAVLRRYWARYLAEGHLIQGSSCFRPPISYGGAYG